MLKYMEIPSSFDVIYSILTLHHRLNPKMVFQSIRSVLESDG